MVDILIGRNISSLRAEYEGTTSHLFTGRIEYCLIIVLNLQAGLQAGYEFATIFGGMVRELKTSAETSGMRLRAALLQ
jgi:hypothetical protein